MVNPRVFLDFKIESEDVGRVIFELFADTCPITVENFKSLCTGSRGVNAAGVPLTYKGSPLHRIIAGFMVQGGDFTLRNGKGGESVYGGTFEDENLKRLIDAEGLLVMANRGRNTNGSQFFVSLRPCPHLDGKHVVFGRVVKGYDIIEGLSKLPCTEKDVPHQLVTISNCGELELRKAAPAPRKRSVSPSSVSNASSTSSHHRSSKRHKEKKDRKERKSSKKHRSSKRDKKDDKPAGPTAEELALAEEKKRVEEELAEEKKRNDELKRREREKELEEIKRKYERNGDRSGPIYKGRGAMKAPDERGGGMRGW
ncbi:hypothetical protein P7C70_g2855, partial [Phenoliferia sp. Uapishka_3]